MISFKEDGKKFNFRVGAVILSNDGSKVLLHKVKGYDFYLLPGGRVEWMEASQEAIARELSEEMGLTNIELKPIAYFESFFNFVGVDYHEISNIFVVRLNKRHVDFEKNKVFHGVQGEEYNIFEWFDINDIDKQTLKPEILKKIIKNCDKPFTYYGRV